MSEKVVYLTAEEEDTHNIAQANAPVDDKGNYENDRVKARFEGDFPVVEPKNCLTWTLLQTKLYLLRLL